MDLIKKEQILLDEISSLIEQGKRTIYVQSNNLTVLLFWKIGKRINNDILENSRAGYGLQIVATLSRKLTEKYGRNFEEKNLRRMMQFANQFIDEEIIVTLSRHLSWSHFLAPYSAKNVGSLLFL